MNADPTQAQATPSRHVATLVPATPETHPELESRPYGHSLGRYLRREIAFPTVFTLLGLSALMLTRQMLGFSDLIVNRGLDVATVAEMALLQLPPLVSDMLPFAVLVGSLVALGRLASDREIVALEACGLAARRLTGPVVTFGVAATAVGLLLACVVSPYSMRRLDATLERIAIETPGATVHAGEAQRFGGWRLQAREASPSGDQVRGVMIEMPELGETVFAERAALESAENGQTRIVLRNGTFVSISNGRPWLVRFDELATLLPTEGTELDRPNSQSFDAAPFAEVFRTAYRDATATGDARARARTQLHTRLSGPVAALVFGFLATPLFLARGGRSRSAGGLLGMIALLVYYGLAQLGSGLDHTRMLPRGLALWIPNLVLVTVAVALQRAVADRSPVADSSGLMRQVVRNRLERWRERSRRAASSGAPAASPARTRVGRRIDTRTWALPRYVAGSFLRMLGLAFAVILSAYLIVDILERLQWFARFNATASEAIRFYGYRVPMLVSRIVPMSLLVATALMVSLTGARGELTAMRASGISAPRGMLPVLVICAIVAPLSFLLSDQIVPRANTLNEFLKATEIKVEEQWYQRGPSAEKAVWFLEGDRLVEAEQLDPQVGIVRGLTIYELDERGLPVTRRDARAGRYLGGGTWRLFDAVHLDLEATRLEPRAGPEFAALWEGVPVEADTRNLSVAELRAEIAWADEHGYDARGLHVDLATKLAAPFACLVLPAVVFLYALAGPPYPKTASALVVSVALGVGSVMLRDLSVSLGYGGVISAGVAGWAPTATFGILSAYLLVRLLRRA